MEEFCSFKMPEFKIVIADPKTGKSYQKALSEQDSEKLIGLKIKSKVDGALVGLSGYELEITGGSDYCGFAMRSDLDSSGRKKMILKKGTGFRIKKHAKQHSQFHYHLMKRKTVRGNTISHRTSQINLKILKYGSKRIEEVFKAEEKAKGKPAEEKPTEEKPKEEKSAEVKEQSKTEKKTEEVKPSGEEKKPEEKSEEKQ